MMNGMVIRAIGIGATLISIGATFITNWVDEKKMEEMVDEKVNEALAKRNKEEES